MRNAQSPEVIFGACLHVYALVFCVCGSILEHSYTQ